MEVREPSAKYLAPSVYKQTEVGVIPEDWDCVQLTTVAQLESGHTPSRRHPEYWGGDIPWVSLHDTDSLDAREIQRTAQTVTPEGIGNSSARLLPQGTVVFSRTATVGKVTTLGREMATSQDFANYICGPRVLNHFLVYLFRWMSPEWKKLMAGSIHNTVYMPAFKTLKVILPPRAEQQAIADALSDADALVESLEQLLAKKRQIKQGAMQELLTGQRRLPGCVGKWADTTLGAIAERILGGGTPSRNNPLYWNGPIPWMTVKDFANFSPSGTAEYITKAGLEGSASNLVPSGTVITSTRMAIGKAVIFKVDVCINQDLKAIYLRKDIDPRFLYFWFQFNEHRIGELGSGSTVMGISLPELAKIQFFKPDHAEQTAIATLLSDMDAELATLEAKLEKARGLKQGMMQELLTGRIRLV